jgi:hypothetical protein
MDRVEEAHEEVDCSASFLVAAQAEVELEMMACHLAGDAKWT